MIGHFSINFHGRSTFSGNIHVLYTKKCIFCHFVCCQLWRHSRAQCDVIIFMFFIHVYSERICSILKIWIRIYYIFCAPYVPHYLMMLQIINFVFFKNVYYAYLVFLNVILSKTNVTVGGVGSDKTLSCTFSNRFLHCRILWEVCVYKRGFTVGNHSATF